MRFLSISSSFNSARWFMYSVSLNVLNYPAIFNMFLQKCFLVFCVQICKKGRTIFLCLSVHCLSCLPCHNSAFLFKEHLCFFLCVLDLWYDNAVHWREIKSAVKRNPFWLHSTLLSWVKIGPPLEK